MSRNPPDPWRRGLAMMDAPAAIVEGGRIVASNDALADLLQRDVEGTPASVLGLQVNGEGTGNELPAGWSTRIRPAPGGALFVWLEESQASDTGRYQQLFAQAAEPMLILDGDGRIDEANEGAGELLGCVPGLLCGRRLEDLLSRGMDRRRLRQALSLAQETHEPIEPGPDWSLRCLDGRDIPIAVAFRCISATDEVRISVSLRGMSQRANEEKNLQELLMELVRTNEDLANFAGQVAHDLQPPLRSMAMLQRHMREHWPDAPRQALQCMADAEAGARRLHDMVHALKELCRVRQEPLHCAPVDLEEVARDVTTLLAAEIEDRDARIIVHDLPRVWADHGMITAALQNLIGNSLKYCQTRPEIHLRSRQDGDRWLIDVEDNGIGIDPARAQQMFDTFWRGHPDHAAQGSGLGLSLVSRVVQRHGGHVMPQPLPDGGTRMRITLPCGPAGGQPGHDSGQVPASLVKAHASVAAGRPDDDDRPGRMCI